jgi:DNA-binding XRE family transcriptional regulator
MRSPVTDILPPRVRRSLAKLGKDLKDARRKRNLTVEMMVERVGVSKATYLKVEKGDPSVSMGVYAMTLFTLGFSNALAEIADSRNDETGMLMDSNRLPQRVRVKKKLKPL